jgi:hypothetical protein
LTLNDLDPRPVGRFQLTLHDPKLKIGHVRVVSGSEKRRTSEDAQCNLRYKFHF